MWWLAVVRPFKPRGPGAGGLEKLGGWFRFRLARDGLAGRMRLGG